MTMQAARAAALALALGPAVLPAAEPPVGPEAPPPPPRLQSGEALEPDVTIIQQRDKTLHEYRVNGVLYMVKVVPVRGPAYYFLDTDGDGELDTREYHPENIRVPQWVLFRW